MIWPKPGVLLYVRMSAVVSISMNQPSNFEESCPSNVGISWSMVVVRLDSLCVGTWCPSMPTWSCIPVPHWTRGMVGALWCDAVGYL